MDKTTDTSSQDKILYQIKRLGPQTVSTLAKALGITTMGARQHLQQLENAGLIESLAEQAQPRGRPARPWKLTDSGHARFPDAHAQVTLELITNIRELLGDEALDRIIDQRTESTLTHYKNQLITSTTLQKKLRTLTSLRSQEGYMAEVERTGKGEYLLIENHCPICIAATECQGFCRSELEVFRSLLADVATVEREDHLLNGARRCTYRVSSLD
jgi:predicted ArsR family transcriptional regulator